MNILCKLGFHIFKKDYNYLNSYEVGSVEYSEKCIFCDTYRIVSHDRLFGTNKSIENLSEINRLKERYFKKLEKLHI